MSAQDFPGGTVGRLSLQYKLNMMLLRWEGMKRCVEDRRGFVYTERPPGLRILTFL